MKTKLLTLIIGLVIAACISSYADNTRVTATVPAAVISANNDSTQTAATGTNYATLATHVCKQVTIINTTGTTIDVAYVSSGNKVQLPDGTAYTFRGLTNATGLKLRRSDVSNTQVTVYWNWENF